jgi:hypothetical protein
VLELVTRKFALVGWKAIRGLSIIWKSLNEFIVKLFNYSLHISLWQCWPGSSIVPKTPVCNVPVPWLQSQHGYQTLPCVSVSVALTEKLWGVPVDRHFTTIPTVCIDA